MRTKPKPQNELTIKRNALCGNGLAGFKKRNRTEYFKD